MEWFDLAHDRSMWRVVVNVVMNIWVHTKRGISH